MLKSVSIALVLSSCFVTMRAFAQTTRSEQIEQEKSEVWRMIGLPMVYCALGRKTDEVNPVGTLSHWTYDGNGNVLGDRTIPHWFAAHRTSGWTQWSLIFTTLGATQAILIVALATCVVFLAVTRRWRPVVFVAALMFGELGAFLVAAAVVHRPRPDVTQLDQNLPTSAYPSGHEAATCCLYIAIAILVIGHARGWWRWLFLVPAIAMPVLVALSRLYRGEHHPTDLLASLLFSALWLTAASVLIKPNSARKQ